MKHPEEVVEVLSRLKDRPDYGATLMQPDHWIIKYATEKGLLSVGRELCGPLRIPTGEMYCNLTQAGVELIK